MINLRAVFVISVLISGLIFSPSYSFAQSNQNDNPLSSLFEMFTQLFSFGDNNSEPVIEFEDAVVIQSSSSTPTADAGPDQNDVMESSKVTLDGSSSTDPNGDILTYSWTQINNGAPAVILTPSNTDVNPMFTAPNVGPLGAVLEFILTVVDTSNLSDTDSVKISVIDKPDDSVDEENSPPTADAGPDQNDVMEFAKVTLDGSSSTDPNGDPISYHWVQVFGTSVTLSSNTAVSPMFTAPEGHPLGVVLKFMLSVVDTSNETGTDDVYITVNKKVGGPGDGPGGGPGDGPGGGPGDGPGDGPGGGPGGGPGNDNSGKGNSGNDKGQDKVTLCHIPPGNPDARHTITVGAPAEDAHLAHGDSLGVCGGDFDKVNKKSNSGKGNNNDDDDDEKGNSGKGNSNIKGEEKSNSGKGNNNDDDDDEKGNSGKGNSNIKGEEKSNSAKVNEDENENDDEDDND